MSTAVQLAAGVARTWVRLYTSRMPPELRVGRRAEVDSDLWDHHNDALEDGISPWRTALDMLLRTCLGVLDDLSWCMEARQPTRRTGRFTMELTARQTRWMGILSVAGAAIVLLLFVIVPTLTSYFATVGIPLPLPTRIVMGMSAFVIAYWWVAAAGVVALFLVVRRLERTVLSRASAGADDASDAAAEALLAKIEPVMIVGLGVVVGGLILSMFLPIFDAVNAMK